MEEVEELLGIEEEFSVTGELVEFDVDVEPGTNLQVISKIHRDETWGLSDKLVLHQVSGTNFVDLSSWLGGVGTIFEKNGLTATVNADSTVTIRGTNENTGSTGIIDMTRWSDEHSEKVYPAGTYTIPDGFTMAIRAAQYPNNEAIPGFVNLNNTVTIPEPFRIVYLRYGVSAGATVDVTLPLGLFRGNSIPETGYEYLGNIYTATFDTPVYDGEFNWSTGELKDADGNTIGYYSTPEIKRLPGTNYFWTCWGENTVSNVSSDLGKVVLRLNETAPEETVPSICEFTLTPVTKNYSMNVYGDSRYFFRPEANLFYGMEVPLVTTRGKFVITNSNGLDEYELAIPELINHKGIADVMTSNSITKRWSNRFYITRNPDSTETIDGDTIATWVFSKKEFEKYGLPVETVDIPIVSPVFNAVTNDELESIGRSAGGVYTGAFSYDAESNNYVFKCRARMFYATALYKWTSAYFCYPLKAEVSLNDNMVSLYLAAGYSVRFEQDDAFDVFWDYALTQYYCPFVDELRRNLWNGVPEDATTVAPLIDTTPSVGIFVPRSVEDALYEAEHIAKRLNHDAALADDYEVNSYNWIGDGDGVTDYTDKIQSKLTEVHNTTGGGVIHLGSGTYPISKSLIVYENTHLIGNRRTVIEQKADNAHAIVLSGSNSSVKDLSVKLSGACTALTACVYVNSDNVPGRLTYDSTLPENAYAQYLTIENIRMTGKYNFAYENGYGVMSDAYDNYKGVGICGTNMYFNFSHIENIKFNELYAGIYGGGSSNYFNVTDMSCRYGIYAIGAAALNTYFIDGHSFYEIDADGKHISMSDEIAHVEVDANSTYHLRCFDSQAFKSYIYLGSKTANNKVDIQTTLSTAGSVRSSHSWNILHHFIVDHGWANVYSDIYKHTPYHIGNRTTTIAQCQHNELSDPVIQNALSGAGIWGDISSNVEFTGHGMTLKDVCRYPSEKIGTDGNNDYLPYILSTVAPSEDNPIEIIIDYSNRPVHGLPNFFIQFWHRNVASDYVVSFDTTNTGVFDFVAPSITNNTNVTDYYNYPMVGGSHTSYRAKFSFTKALQIPNLQYTLYDDTFDYNPEGLIGICNIGMTVNDYAGRSFLGECGGSLYGNVDMHQHTLKNLSPPVDDGDAVSKAHMELRLAEIGIGDIEAALDAIIEIQNELIGGDDA